MIVDALGSLLAIPRANKSTTYPRGSRTSSATPGYRRRCLYNSLEAKPRSRSFRKIEAQGTCDCAFALYAEWSRW